MRLLLLIVFLSCLISSPVIAQKVLQMEKYGKLKTKKYFIGQDLVFQLNGKKDWYHETIQDILVDEKLILFPTRIVKLEDITAIKSFKNRGWSRGLSNNAYVASGAFVGLSLFTTAIGYWELSPASIIIPGVTVVVAWIIRKIFKSRTYKIGKKRKLRLLDLNFHPIHPRP